MANLRAQQPGIGDPHAVTATVETSAGAGVPSYRLPRVVTGLPRIAATTQNAGETLGLDTTGLTGITGYRWLDGGGETGVTTASLDTTGLTGGLIACEVTCEQGVLTSPALRLHGSMEGHDMAHKADDDAVVSLVPHADATHIAVADGVWTDGATWWGGQVPGAGARVLIPVGRVVIYDEARGARMDWLRNDGTLRAATDTSTRMRVETIVNTRGATLEIGTESTPIPAGVTHEIVISDRDYRTSPLAPSDIDIARDPKLIGRGIVNLGTRIMRGAPKTPWLRTKSGQSAPLAGDTSATLSAAPIGWQAGDRLVIGGTIAHDINSATPLASETEVVTLTNIVGDVITWDTPLAHDHDHHAPGVTRTDLQPAIGNLTRNVVIRSERADGPAHRRGHTMDMHHMCLPDIDNIEMRALGRTVKKDGIPSGKIDANGDFIFPPHDPPGVPITAPLTAASNLQSRYPAHFHFIGFNRPFTGRITNCVVNGSPGWAITHHGCEAVMNGNVMHDFAGAGMVGETANETGEWVGNLAVNARNRSPENPKDIEGTPTKMGDAGRWGSGFFAKGRAIRIVDNFAMDLSQGLVFAHREDNETITPILPLLNPTIDVSDLMGFFNKGGVSGKDYPLHHVSGNEMAGCQMGLVVYKAEKEQNHGLRSMIANTKAWGFSRLAVHNEYVMGYIVIGTDAIGMGVGTGVDISSNTYEISVVDTRTENCGTGIHFQYGSTFGDSSPYDTTDNPRYYVAGHISINDGQAINDHFTHDQNDIGESRLRVDAQRPAAVTPTLDLPFRVATVQFGSGTVTNAQTGSLTDSLGTLPIPSPADGQGIGDILWASASALNDEALANGYWTDTDGTEIIVRPLYFSDRQTGRAIKVYRAVDISSFELWKYTDNGPYDRSANAPNVGAASIATTPEIPASLDVLALASDADGDTLTLSEAYIAPNHGRLEIAGGVVTYSPDPGFTGTDTAQVAVEDGRGRARAVRIAIDVT